jgi:AraC-like DNA-binding protein
MYIEIKPIRALAQYFDSFWYSENLTFIEKTEKILPDGCSDIIIPLSGNKIQPIFVGYMTKYINAIIYPGEKILGLRFNPGYSYPVIKDTMSQFTDKIVELSAIKNIDFSTLQDDFQENGKINFMMLEFILNKLIRPPLKKSYIFYALNVIKNNPGFLKIEELANSLNISRRFLEKEFKKYIGMTPKKYTQIERFKKILKNKDRKSLDAALEYGYYDQSHFIKEFKEFSGETPRKFFSS